MNRFTNAPRPNSGLGISCRHSRLMTSKSARCNRLAISSVDNQFMPPVGIFRPNHLAMANAGAQREL